MLTKQWNPVQRVTYRQHKLQLQHVFQSPLSTMYCPLIWKRVDLGYIPTPSYNVVIVYIALNILHFI